VTVRRIIAFWRNLWHRERVEADLHDELHAAFESMVEDHLRAGLSPGEARRAAALAFGPIESVKDRVRDVRSGASLDTVRLDVRYAARLLRRSPLFAIVATLSLAIGIGATTTIFTVGNGLLFRAPPGARDPDALVEIFRAEEGVPLGNFTSSYPYFLDVQQRASSLAGVFSYELEPRPITVGASDGTDVAFANLVSSNYFTVVGVQSAAGRLFTPADDSTFTQSVAVLSHRYWQRRFKGDATVVGTTVQINRRPFTVVGVADDRFHGVNLLSPEVWLPISAIDAVQPGTGRLTNRGMLDLGMGGRLKPGVSRAQAASELDQLARQIEREYPQEHGIRLRVMHLRAIPGALTGVATGLFALLFGIVSTVLIIACANVSGVLLARAAVRRREIAVRMAIGAGRHRLVQQLLTETMLLCVLGGATGLALARGMTSLLLAALPAFPVPIDISLPLDDHVVAFAAAVSFVASGLAGLAPALHASRADVIVALKDESQGPLDRLRLRSGFVIAQVAFSSMLVVLAALLVQALGRIGATHDFDPHGVEASSIDLAAAGYTGLEGETFARELVDRLRGLSGMEAATLAQWMPGRGGTDVAVTVPGLATPDGDSLLGTANAVESDFFRVLRVPLLAGRDFSASDTADRAPVTIISETTARYLWPNESAVDRYITWHEHRARTAEIVTNVKIIGVVPDLRSPFGTPRRRERSRNPAQDLDARPSVAPPVLMMYVPMRQRFAPRFSIFARAREDRAIAPEIRRVVRAMDINLPIIAAQPLDAQMGPIYLQIRMAASVAAAVGVVGVLLAAMGVYGVAAYATQSRTREMGVRLALGAQHGDIVRIVLRQGMTLVLAGSTMGLAFAVAAGRVLSSRLPGVEPFSATAFSAVAMLLCVVGLVACYVPARNAMRIDAMDALRYE
jgi:putative ABC transport system permease protein